MKYKNTICCGTVQLRCHKMEIVSFFAFFCSLNWEFSPWNWERNTHIFCHLEHTQFRSSKEKKTLLYEPQHWISCNQQRLRPACPYADSYICAVWSEPLLVTWIFYEYLATDRTSFGVSKLKRRLHMLIWVNTCQNATLLEITCHGSIMAAIFSITGFYGL